MDVSSEAPSRSNVRLTMTERSARTLPRPTDDSLQRVTDDVWVVSRPLRFFGVQVGTRMTVVRLGDGGVWLHSPVPIDDALAAALAAIGPVRHIVAPNHLHHLFAGDAKRRYPEARLHVAPGLVQKRSDLEHDSILAPDVPPPWGTEILRHVVRGLRVLGEVVFFHVPTRTLVVSDLVFNFGRDAPWATRLFGRLTGTYGHVGCPLELRLFFISDEAAFGASIAAIAQWDFERIVVAHGDIAARDAKEAFRRAFAFLGRDALRQAPEVR